MNHMDDLNNKFKTSAENFSLTPNATVWTKVEIAIQKRKRKRRFIIFFLIASFIGGSGFFFRKKEVVTKKETILEETISTQSQSNEINKKPNSTDIVTNAVVENSSMSSRIQDSKEEQRFEKRKSTNAINTSIKSKTKTHSSLSVLAKDARNEPVEPEVAVAAIETLATAPTQSTQKAQSSEAPSPPSEIAFVNEPMKIDSAADMKAEIIQEKSRADTSQLAVIDTTKKESVVDKKDSLSITAKKSRWSISLGIAPTLTYSKYKESGDYQIISNYRDSSDKNILTFNYHLLLHCNISKKAELFTGIGIRNIEQELLTHQAVYKYDTNYVITLPNPLVTIGRGYSNINGDSTGVVTNKFSYLEIPIGIRYNLLPAGKFNISIDGQVGMNKLISSEGYIYDPIKFTYEKLSSADLNSWMYSYGVGLSFQYSIIKGVNIELSPSYTHFPNSIYKKTDPLEQYFDQTEFLFSVRYLIK